MFVLFRVFSLIYSAPSGCIPTVWLSTSLSSYVGCSNLLSSLSLMPFPWNALPFCVKNTVLFNNVWERVLPLVLCCLFTLGQAGCARVNNTPSTHCLVSSMVLASKTASVHCVTLTVRILSHIYLLRALAYLVSSPLPPGALFVPYCSLGTKALCCMRHFPC